MAPAIPYLLALMVAAWIAAVITRRRAIGRAPVRIVTALGALLAVSHAIGLWA